MDLCESAHLAIVFMLSLTCNFAGGQQLRLQYDLNYMPAQRDTILSKHNQLRVSACAANMQELVWDPELANLALDWARRCTALHRPGDQRLNSCGFGYVGENIWWHSSYSFPDLNTVVQNLWDELYFYSYQSNSCNGYDCGHYTQCAWADTCALGCAVALCDQLVNANIWSGHIVVCNYGPGGNVYGQWPYVPSTACGGLLGSSCRRKKRSLFETHPFAAAAAQVNLNISTNGPLPNPACFDNASPNFCALVASSQKCAAANRAAWRCKRTCNLCQLTGSAPLFVLK